MLSDSDSEDIHQLTINEHFAKAYDHKKEREELSKLKEKYGSDVEDIDSEEVDSEEDETEDEDGEELTPAVDAAIFRTLARIKRKDPSIYEQGKDVFEEEKAKTGDSKIGTRQKRDKSKPLTMRQHALASVLNPDSRSPSPEPLTHVAEQEALKKETVDAFHTAVSDAEEGDLLVLREKTKDELGKEEEEYKEFLQREVGVDLQQLIVVDDAPLGDGAHEESGKTEEAKKEKKKKKKGKGETVASKEEEDQKFLLDYILNRGWIDKSSRHLPTYKEVTSSKKGKGKSKGKQKAGIDSDAEGSGDNASEGGDESVRGGVLEDDEEFEEVAERFENSYNFRFEEPGADTISRYPRNMVSTVRREENPRKEARERRKQRKEEELLQRREEVKRLKALKMKEIRSKLDKIGKEGGMNLDDEALRVLDLEGDWDPQVHDRQMAELYGGDGEGPTGDDEKPTWDDDIDITDIAPETTRRSDKKKKKKKKKKDDDGMDEGGVDIDEMDADVARGGEDDEEEWDGSEAMRKKVLDRYMDELYKMEFNDLVGDIPTRFRYTPVDPSSYSLTPAEILLASDAELNQYVGMRKFAPYRDKKKEKWDHTRNTRLGELKEKIKGRGWGGETYVGEDERGAKNGEEGKLKKRKGKKERMKLKAASAAVADDAEEVGQDGEAADLDQSEAPSRLGKRHRDEKFSEPHAQSAEETSRKRRRRHKKSVAGQEP